MYTPGVPYFYAQPRAFFVENHSSSSGVRFSSTAPTDPSNHPIYAFRISALAFLPPVFLLLPPLPLLTLRWLPYDSPPYRGLWPQTRRDYGPDDHAASVPLLRPGSSLPSKERGGGGGAGSRFGGGGPCWPAVSPIRKRGALGGLSILSC